MGIHVLVTTSLAIFAALAMNWDSLVPGTQLNGFTERPLHWDRGEARVYVGNAHCVSPPNALVYDFPDIAAKESRGYNAVQLPPSGEGRRELSLCFRQELAQVKGEIRGLYDGVDSGGGRGSKVPWPFVWITFDGVFAVQIEGGKRTRIGEVIAGVWHKATFCIPPNGEKGTAVNVKLERTRPDGSFRIVGEKSLPLGSLVIRSVNSFDLWGHGPSKYQFDDFSFRVMETAGL